jgi:hypothetical protein
MNHNSSPRYQIRNARNEVSPPISLEELRKWVNEGRVGEGDRITQVGSGVWGKKQDFPELGYNAAAARTEIDSELSKTKRVRVALALSFMVPAAIAIALFAVPSYDASEEIRLERQAASQARIEAIKATEKMKAAVVAADIAKRKQDDAERQAKVAEDSAARLKGDVDNAMRIADTLKGGSDEQSRLLSAFESQVRKAEASSSKSRIENLELRQKLARAEESLHEQNKELADLKTQLEEERKKSIVQKIFDTK